MRSPARDIQAFLESCVNLEELDLKTNMDVYPNNLNMGKLKKLSIESTGYLLRITDFLQQQKDSLEALSLTLKLSKPNQTDELLARLRSLKRLKKLKLKTQLETSAVNAFNIAELIEELEYLEEADFLDLVTEFKKDSFSGFCKALQNR